MSISLAAATEEEPITRALASDQGTYGLYEIAKLRASPDNRKRFNEQALQELAESIKSMGVAQAILIRPVTPTADAPAEYEIVAGERRFRASKIAGKTHIPALCRQLSDLDAAKIRILENLQREDPHPMEEAEGYQLLMLQHAFTADQLVNEVKKSRAYIYARLKLCALTPAVREQFLDNKLSASTALLVARIPVPALQVKAAQEVMDPYGTGVPMSARDAASHIQGRYMLKLSTAVFSITDGKLLAAAGACTKCPKRTGNQPEIFEGIDPNVCTDPDCFAEKRAAHSAALLVEANKRGIPVLEGDEAAQTLSHRYSRSSELVTADMNLWYFERNAPATQNNGYVNDFLRGEFLPTVAGYVKRDDGTLTPLYKRADVQAALEACEACETVEAHAKRMAEVQASTPVSAKAAAERKKEEELDKKAQELTKFRVAVYMKLRARAAANGLSLQSLREITKLALEEWNLPDELCEAYDFDYCNRQAINEYIDQAGLPEVQLLLIDSLLGNAFDVSAWDIKNGNTDEDDFTTVLNIAHHEGIDVDAVRTEMFMADTKGQPTGTEPGAEQGTESAPAQETSTVADPGDVRNSAAAVRYRNPADASQTWTGRGKQPRWVSEWVAGGKSLDGLQVNPAPAAVDLVDGKQLAEQIAETEEGVQTSAGDKKAKGKPAAKSGSSKKAEAKAQASK